MRENFLKDVIHHDYAAFISQPYDPYINDKLISYALGNEIGFYELRSNGNYYYGSLSNSTPMDKIYIAFVSYVTYDRHVMFKRVIRNIWWRSN